MDQKLKTKNQVEATSVEEISKSLKISGIRAIKKTNNKSASKANRESTKSFQIDKYIYNNYTEGEEFVTGEMSAHFREQGWKVADISGQLHAKKVAGLLTNRKPTDDEAALLGKGISIWKATSLFYERLEAEINLLTESSKAPSEDDDVSSDVDELE